MAREPIAIFLLGKFFYSPFFIYYHKSCEMKNRRIERTTLETYRIAPERKLGVEVEK